MKYFLILTLIASTYAATPCDNIRTRAQWGSRRTSLTSMSATPKGFAIHHSEGARCTTQKSCDTQMRNIQNYHINSRGWNDIGYNFLIGDPGQIYEGRGYGKVGAHAVGFNRIALGLCFMGSHTSTLPTATALSNTQAFIKCSINKGKLVSNYWLSTHRNDRQTTTGTNCPGNALYNKVKTWAKFTAKPN